MYTDEIKRLNKEWAAADLVAQTARKAMDNAISKVNLAFEKKAAAEMEPFQPGDLIRRKGFTDIFVVRHTNLKFTPAKTPRGWVKGDYRSPTLHGEATINNTKITKLSKGGCPNQTSVDIYKEEIESFELAPNPVT